MKVGVWIPDQYLHSVRIYFEHVSACLQERGVTFVRFGPRNALPKEVDLYWDPTCTGGKNPNKRFRNARKPLIATVHGASNFALPHHYTYRGWKQQLKGYFINARRKFYWNFFRNSIKGIITVSEFAKSEIVRELQLRAQIIQPVHHGYDDHIFFHKENTARNYLFHVSVYQPVKNIDTLISAYQELPEERRLPLIMVVPGYPGTLHIPGITLITKPVPQATIAEYMQGARAFILPSVRESFGLPLIEAMACGTPVITSYGSACEEIAGGYGLLCSPLQVSDWRLAIDRISSDDAEWQRLHQHSLQRAKDFSWEKCATAHLRFFQKILGS